MPAVRRQDHPLIHSDIFHAYADCALWAESLQSKSIEDIARESRLQMHMDVAKFYKMIVLVEKVRGYRFTLSLQGLGHDFWLTRNGHGTGFWDRDLPNNDGEILTEIAKQFPEVMLYTGDDGRLYMS